MLENISNILEVMTVAIGIVLLERYVFLEPGMEAGKQRFFYGISVVLILLSFLLWGKDVATMTALFAGGLNIALGRKKHRVRGFFLMIPLTGILNGLVVPPLVMFPALIASSEIGILYFRFALYAVLGILLILFAVKGKEFRKGFSENMAKRHLHGWESTLLCIAGILQMSFSDTIARQLIWNRQMKNAGYAYAADGQFAMDIGLFGLIAFVLTVTIIVLIMQGNKRTYYHEKVSDMQFSMIETMADIVESRDGNTGGHIRRTKEYVRIIANALQKENKYKDVLTGQYIADMIVAAPLHDIGKIHIPDAILNKPGRLTEEEFAIMKSHAAAGKEMLQKARQQMGDFAYLNLAIDMAAYHHEWWNGAGYPEGIAGEQIPLCARIMAVADVFDALTSKRCYKDAMPLEKAYGIIRGETGTHFDPVVSEAFFASVDEVEAAMQNYDKS